MSLDQTLSILAQIGASAIAMGLLYKLQLLMDGFDSEARQQMERMRDSRRQATQEYVATLKQMDVGGAPLIAPDILGIENSLVDYAQRNEEGDTAPKISERVFDGETSETWQIELSRESMSESVQ